MSYYPEAKSTRLLAIYSRLVSGETLSRPELMREFNVSLRSLQRDIEALRGYFVEHGLPQEITYSQSQGGYRLELTNPRGLTNDEILAVCKILLESRSMRRDEMMPILDKLIDCAVPEDGKRRVQQLISNESFHYVEPHHGQKILHGLWEIGEAIQEHRVMEIEYERLKEPRLVHRRVQPVGLMFSEFYFYLTAFLEDKDRSTFDNPDDLFPTIYRVDRIRDVKVLDERFHVPYCDRFEEGEFRKRVQFMYGGRLQRIRFRYTGTSLEAVLDRLPTARVVSENADGGGCVVEAEVFGKGIEAWLRAQGENISQAEYMAL